MHCLGSLRSRLSFFDSIQVWTQEQPGVSAEIFIFLKICSEDP